MRVYEGDTYFWSRSSKPLALGPGGGVLIAGKAHLSNCHMRFSSLIPPSGAFYIQDSIFSIQYFWLSLRRAVFNIGAEALGHLYFGAMIHGPGGLMRSGFHQARRGRMAVAALLHAAERQVHLGADGRQIDIAHAIFAFLAEEPHGAIVFRDDGHR